MRRHHVIAGLRGLLGVVLAYAGIIKIQESAEFADAIAGFRLLPVELSNLLALGLPPFEILLGVWLISGWKRRTAAFCAFILCGVFLLALVSAAVRGIAVDCGCFGPAAGSLSPENRLWLSVGRDVGLLAMAGVVHVESWNRK